jgi:hypothetical protein
MTLNTRPPTGTVPYPLILVEGDEKSGKSWSAAMLSTSSKVGQTYWIDLGEGSADEYGAIPGANYLVVDHDGTFGQILDQILEVKTEAARARDAGEPPVVLAVDSMSALWDGLKDWTTSRAVARARKRGKSTADEDLRITTDLWNDAGARYRKVMTQLLTFPGIVIVTARGKEVVSMGANGQPIEGKREHKVEGHKSLAFDATVWLRLSRTQPPTVIGARSVHAGIIPGKHDPQPIEQDHPNLLEWLIFDALKVGQDSTPRDLKDVTGGDLTEDEKAAEDGSPVIPSEPSRVSREKVKKAAPNPEWVAGWEKQLGEAQSAKQFENCSLVLTSAFQHGQITRDEYDACAAVGKTTREQWELTQQQRDERVAS